MGGSKNTCHFCSRQLIQIQKEVVIFWASQQRFWPFLFCQCFRCHDLDKFPKSPTKLWNVSILQLNSWCYTIPFFFGISGENFDRIKYQTPYSTIVFTLLQRLLAMAVTMRPLEANLLDAMYSPVHRWRRQAVHTVWLFATQRLLLLRLTHCFAS